MNQYLPCEILGESNTETIVLITGVGGDHKTWGGFRAQLARNYRVIVINNRGVGLQEDLEESYTTFDMMQDVIEQMDALDIQQAHILGHSLGGAVAQLLAIHHPERVNKLILVSTRAYFCKKSQFYYDTMVKLMEQKVPRELQMQNLFLFLFGKTFFENVEYAEACIKAAAMMPSQLSLHNYQLQIQAVLTHDSRAITNKIKASTLVMIGAEDIICLPQDSLALATTIPHMQLEVLEHSGHMPFVECEVLFLEKLLQFLRQTPL